MFDFAQILEFAKLEPGHGMVQSVLLFMIWAQSKGLRKELASLKEALAESKSLLEKRFEKIELRVTVLEKGERNATGST